MTLSFQEKESVSLGFLRNNPEEPSFFYLSGEWWPWIQWRGYFANLVFIYSDKDVLFLQQKKNGKWKNGKKRNSVVGENVSHFLYAAAYSSVKRVLQFEM